MSKVKNSFPFLTSSDFDNVINSVVSFVEPIVIQDDYIILQDKFDRLYTHSKYLERVLRRNHICY